MLDAGAESFGCQVLGEPEDMSTSGSYRESLARHCPNEALHLGLVVVVVHAGAWTKASNPWGQIEPRRAGLVYIDVHGADVEAPLRRCASD